MYVIVSLFYLLSPWLSLSPRDLWSPNSRHRKKFPRFWVGRHILRPQLSVMLGKHEPLNPIFLSIGSLYHHVGSNVSVLSWYEMLTSLFLLYWNVSLMLLFLWFPQNKETLSLCFSNAFLLRLPFAAPLSPAEQLWPPPHTLSSESQLPDGSCILPDFLLPMKLEGALFISFLLHCEMGSTPANMNLTLTFDSTVMWLSPSLGLPLTANPVSPLQISLLHQLLLPLALTFILWTVEGLSGRYFCFSYETPCAPFSLFF